MKEFYRFQAEAVEEPTSAEVLIFDAIGDANEIGEISAKQFARDLAKMPSTVKRLDIHINSPGGNVFDAQAIYSRLADHKSEKIVYVDGLAASAASIVAMVGHKRYIRANANMMIHLPSGLAIGNAEDMRKMAAALDSVTEPMINIYEKHTGLERKEIRDMLAAETWFSPQEAVEKGFADEVRGVVKAAAVFDLSQFHNVPKALQSGNKAMKIKAELTEKEEEELKELQEKEEDDELSEREEDRLEELEEKQEEEAKTKGKRKRKAQAAVESPPPKPKPKPAPGPEPPEPEPDAASSTARTEYEQGVIDERARVLALQKLDRPATHAIITAAIKDGKCVADVTNELFEALEKFNARVARHADASVLTGIPPTDGADDRNLFGSLIKEKFEARHRKGGARARK